MDIHKKESEAIILPNTSIPCKCKCGINLLLEGKGLGFTTMVSSVKPAMDVVDIYSCDKCHTVIKRNKKYDKNEVLNAIEKLNHEDIYTLILGELASGEKVKPEYTDTETADD